MQRVLSDRYELGSLVGAGGTARVYEAHDRTLGRRVAVKLLDGVAAASNDPAGRDRFLAEARSSASFSHRGAVAVFDAGEADGDLFIVMEFVDGSSLAQLIASRAPMPEAEAVRIVTELLDALGAAHDVGIVHRDVKPANILVARDGAVKLADFGIAKRFDEVADSLTNAGTVIGTPRYLAPEQAAGRPATPAVDVYAVGIVLHEMLAGASPTMAPDLRAARPDVSPEVVQAVARALSPDPEDRYASAAAMAAVLRGDRARATPPVAAAGATQVMTRADAPTQVLARAVAPTAVAPTTPRPPRELDVRIPEPHRRDRPPRWWAVSLVTVAVVGIGALALAQRGPVTVESATETSGSATSIVADEPVTVETEPVDALEPNDPTATLSVAPQPDPDAASSTEAAPPEVVPGFPATDDILVFIAQLREGKDVAGKQSKKLGDKLHELLEEDDEDLPDEARELAEELREWVEDGEIEPAIAEATLEFIAPLR